MMIGTRIKYLLDEMEMTQRELAEILHISASTLNGYIKKGKEPDYDMLIRLANFFHTSTDYLLGRTNIRTVSEQDISDEEGALLGVFRLLPLQQQQIVLDSIMVHYRHVCDSHVPSPKTLQSANQ